MKKKLFILLVFLCALLALPRPPGREAAKSQAPQGNLTIHFLDVGQGDCAILLCEDEVLMIDGGSASQSSKVYAYLKNTLGVSHIDHLIATHPHEDHIGGLSGALNACTAGTLYSPVDQYDSRAFRSLLKYAGQQGASLVIPSAGDTFRFGGASVQFLSPQRDYPNENNNSLVVRICYGRTSFLFAADAEYEAEQDMLASSFPLESTLLKVGHHGSDSSSCDAFIRAVSPAYALVSTEKSNSYGHPAATVLSRLASAGIAVYRTDLHGTVVCTSDGVSLSFAAEKGGAAAPMQTPAPAQTQAAPAYIGNRNSHKFHIPSCPSVSDMKDKNKVPFFSREDAIAGGYLPCKACAP